MQIARGHTENLCGSNPPINQSLTLADSELRPGVGMDLISSDQASIRKSISSSVIGVENEIQFEVPKP